MGLFRFRPDPDRCPGRLRTRRCRNLRGLCTDHPGW